MRLPVYEAASRTSPAKLIRLAKQSELARAEAIAGGRRDLGLDGLTAVIDPRGRSLPTIDGAYELDVASDEAGDPSQRLATIERAFAEAGARCRRIVPAQGETPGEWLAALVGSGYRPRAKRVVRLVQRRLPSLPRLMEEAGPAKVQIIPGRAHAAGVGEAAAAAAREAGAGAREASEAAEAAIDELDETRAEPFLLMIDGRPAAAANVISFGETGVLIPPVAVGGGGGERHGDAAAEPACPGRPAADERSAWRRLLTAACLDHCERSLFRDVIADLAEGSPAEAESADAGFAGVGGYLEFVLAACEGEQTAPAESADEKASGNDELADGSANGG